MKNIVIAAVLAATATCADATVFKFTGTDFDGFAVSGALTIDTTMLVGANGASSPASYYYFATGDASSTALLPFLSVNFSSSAGNNPSLLSHADYTYHFLQNDPADGSLGLELDYQRGNLDGTLTSSTFTLSGFDAFASKSYGGIRLPDFANAGIVYFDAKSGTGVNETYDTESAGAITFSAAVPETSTWAMMTAGFGAIGYAHRRRRRVVPIIA